MITRAEEALILLMDRINDAFPVMVADSVLLFLALASFDGAFACLLAIACELYDLSIPLCHFVKCSIVSSALLSSNSLQAVGSYFAALASKLSDLIAWTRGLSFSLRESNLHTFLYSSILLHHVLGPFIPGNAGRAGAR